MFFSSIFQRLSYFCFETIFSRLCNISIISNLAILNNFNFPIFVTWRSKYNNELRGCIGTVESGSLGKNIHNFALESAFNDSRFNPITLPEIGDLVCSVSLLYGFEVMKNLYDWQPGKHGLKLELNIRYRQFTSLFLPEVCIECGWSKSQTIDQLLKKAGVHWRLSYHHKQQIRLTRFQTMKISSDFVDFHNSYLDNIKLILNQTPPPNQSYHSYNNYDNNNAVYPPNYRNASYSSMFNDSQTFYNSQYPYTHMY